VLSFSRCLELGLRETFKNCEGHSMVYGIFTVHFHKIENNGMQQMHLNTFIRYINTPTCFGPSGPYSGSYTL
jgi:hypothetical protein